MKHPGRPETPPSWYRDRGQSHIEQEFSSNLDELASAIQQEHWFGDAEKHSRYRVDFLLKDARLIVELDGHDYHSTKDQLEHDAIRQRYLTRAGFTVIRFAGREIVRDVKACVTEVRTIYEERMQRSPAKYRVLYIDYPFFQREMTKALRFYRKEYPQRGLEQSSIEQFLPHAVNWLQEKSFIAAFIFYPPEDHDGLASLNGTLKEYDRGEIRINLCSDELYSVTLGEHLKNYSHLFDQFFLVADDFVYLEPMGSVLPEELVNDEVGSMPVKTLPNGKLLRRGNDHTAFGATDLRYVLWQDIWYALGASMGLAPHEL